MKFWKHTMISALAFLGVSTTVLYTACEKDSCTQLKCQNEAPCVDGFCVCKDGFEGVECRDIAVTRFAGRYAGSTVRNNIPYNFDSAYVDLDLYPNYIAFQLYSDIKNGINTTYKGKIEGNKVVSRDEAAGTYFEMIEDNDKITIYIEETVNGAKNKRNFIGTLLK